MFRFVGGWTWFPKRQMMRENNGIRALTLYNPPLGSRRATPMLGIWRPTTPKRRREKKKEIKEEKKGIYR